MDSVDRTLALWRSTPFVWGGGDRAGHADCLLSVGEHIEACGGPNTVRRFWGTYSDEAGAKALLDAHGGAAGLLDLTGLQRTERPVRGDIMVVEFPEGETAGLCTGYGYAVRMLKGVVEIDMRFVRQFKGWSCLL
jgi:hypothetical protein